MSESSGRNPPVKIKFKMPSSDDSSSLEGGGSRMSQSSGSDTSGEIHNAEKSTPVFESKTEVSASMGVSVKKEKMNVKAQDTSAQTSNLGEFVRRMRTIRLKKWKHKIIDLKTVGSIVYYPIWIQVDQESNNKSFCDTNKEFLNEGDSSHPHVVVPLGGTHPVFNKKNLKHLDEEILLSERKQIHDLLKSIMPDQSYFYCNLTHCLGKREFYDKNKFRRHLHNHLRLRRAKDPVKKQASTEPEHLRSED